MSLFAKLEITEVAKITKFAEGVDPKTGKPFEIVEQVPVVLKGEQAAQRLRDLGLTDKQILDKMKEVQ